MEGKKGCMYEYIHAFGNMRTQDKISVLPMCVNLRDRHEDRYMCVCVSAMHTCAL